MKTDCIQELLGIIFTNQGSSKDVSFMSSYKEKWLRLCADSMLRLLPYPIYRSITTGIKKLRVKTNRRNDIQESTQLHTEKLVGICLTHDIDTAQGYDLLPRILEIEEKYNVRSTCNVLTHGPYTLDLRYLDELEKKGFKIGLHGDRHDIAFGFRDRKNIKYRLQKSLDFLERRIVGYRAPALAITPRLFSILQELGFQYDSSIKYKGFYSTGVLLNVPYRYPGNFVWEFPLIIQDDSLFREHNFSSEQALHIILGIINQYFMRGGVFVINTHPINIKDYMEFYDNFLYYINETVNTCVILAEELVVFLNKAEIG